MPVNVHILTLPLSHTTPPTPSRPAAWLRGAGSVGTRPPLFLVQDLGTLLTQPGDRLQLARPGHLPKDLDTSIYQGLLSRLSTYPLLREVSTWDISDSVAGVIIARLVNGVNFPKEYAIPHGTEAVDFARQLAVELDRADPRALWHRTGPAERPNLSDLLPQKAIAQIETNLRRLDAHELRFLHRYGPRFSGAPDPREMLDLFTLLDLPPTVRLTMSQVLRLLPSVSQSVTMGGVQTYAMGGYEGLTQKGNLDSLMPTELAYPNDIFLHRLLNNEALYYGREGERERQRELAYIVTQAGLEMLGDGQVLAQGLTLALAQTMQRRGYEVQQSFVGSKWTNPSGMGPPRDVQRVLYYRDDGWLKAEEMLKAVSKQLRAWKEQYQGIQVFWVVSEHWDADECVDHGELYQALRQQAGQQAWFIQVGKGSPGGNGRCLAAAKEFHRYHSVYSELLWSEEHKKALAGYGKKRDIPQQPVPEKKPPFPRRKEPITVSEDDFIDVFKLNENWRPLEYIENDFEDRGETVMDHATGLLWQKSGSDEYLTYEQAGAYVERLNSERFAGYNDWRLPTIDELTSLLEPEEQSNGLYINPIFDAKQLWCWSSDRRSPGGAWNVNFDHGDVLWDSLSYNYVRVVRS
jgi:hypothetical protein